MKLVVAAGLTRAACLAAAVVASACAVPAPGGPDVRALSNGAEEVVFQDGCTVRFDARGREVGAMPVCTRDQRRRARELVEARSREPARTGSWGGREPEVVMARSGAGRVVYRDGCVVDYDREGERQARSRECSGDQLREADHAMATHRRQFGLDRWARGQPPEVSIGRSGAGRVVYRDGCVVSYDRRGERQGSNRECGSEQVRRADRIMADHRREQGVGVPDRRDGDALGGPRAAEGPVSVGTDGDTEVRVDRRCTVRYDVDGRRLDASPGCDAAQLKAADRLEMRFRFWRLNQQGQGD